MIKKAFKIIMQSKEDNKDQIDQLIIQAIKTKNPFLNQMTKFTRNNRLL